MKNRIKKLNFTVPDCPKNAGGTWPKEFCRAKRKKAGIVNIYVSSFSAKNKRCKYYSQIKYTKDVGPNLGRTRQLPHTARTPAALEISYSTTVLSSRQDGLVRRYKV